MDQTNEVTIQFNNTLRIKPSPKLQDKIENSKLIYKSYFSSERISSQEDRRRKLFIRQKKAREVNLNKHRHLAIMDNMDLKTEYSLDEFETEYFTEEFEPEREYKNMIMESEWLSEVPPTLHEEWLCVLCPRGRRTLIVAKDGITQSFRKDGRITAVFESGLPGGSDLVEQDRAHFETVLDCIWDPYDEVIYVLDVISWRNQPFIDCDTDFRFYWIETQFEAMPLLKKVGKYNTYEFRNVERSPCDQDTLKEFFAKPRNNLDGILFYHRGAHYTHGSTPLVGWLLPWMVPEILKMDAPQIIPDEQETTNNISKKKSPRVSKQKTSKTQSPDILKTESSDILKKESPEVLEEQSREIFELESSEISKKESLEIAKTEFSKSSKIEQDNLKMNYPELPSPESVEIWKTDTEENSKIESEEHSRAESAEIWKTDSEENSKIESAEISRAESAEIWKTDSEENSKIESAEISRVESAEIWKTDSEENSKMESADNSRTESAEIWKTESVENSRTESAEIWKTESGENSKGESSEAPYSKSKKEMTAKDYIETWELRQKQMKEKKKKKKQNPVFDVEVDAAAGIRQVFSNMNENNHEDLFVFKKMSDLSIENPE